MKYSYRVGNINRKKDFLFKVRVSNQMCEEIKGLVNLKRNPNNREIMLNERQ